MRKFVKLFFTLILIGSMAVALTTSPVFAEEISDTPTEKTKETAETTETGEASGDEWDGIIEDPANTPAETPATTETAPVVITEVTTTVTSPATTRAAKPQTSTQSNTIAETPIESKTTETEESTEITETNPTDSANSAEPAEETIKKTKEEQSPVEVPTTSTPAFIFDGTTRKITLLALISTTIIYFLGIEIWGIKNLIRIRKNEKLLKTAKEKASVVKQAKISRSTN